jgi:two-component sensor histidine kinase
VRFTLRGDGGHLPAHVATPLSVVLTELLQNSVDHGFPVGSGGGNVAVELTAMSTGLRVTVVDDGVGIADGFDLESATGLGLSIVRTLVTTELAGTIDMRPATAAELAGAGLEPAAPRRGTTVSLVVPLESDSPD